MKPKDLTGISFGKLIVLSGPYGRSYKWECQCECGEILYPQRAALNAGQTQCRKCSLIKAWNGKRTHGRAGTPEYIIWQGIQQRCKNPKEKAYPRYGGRGISVCKRWVDSFESFFEDMGKRPSDGHSIDRIDNDGNYEPGNCRWATFKEQCNNTSRNSLITFNGTTRTISEWADHIGINYSTLFYRFKNGWSIEKALTIKTLSNHEGNPSGLRNSPTVLLRRI
jgi:hypothetical protein